MSLTSEEPDPRDEDLHQDSLSTEDKEGDEVDEDDNEGFEETLIEPRPLNEVTSATDRTSPWTTMLSDPELDSVESLEATVQPVDLIHEKGRKTATSSPVTSCTPPRTATDSDLSSGTESCQNAGEDAENVHNVCLEHGDEEASSNKDFTQNTRQMTDHDQHDSTTDAEDDSPSSSSSESCAKTNSESEQDERKAQLYPFFRAIFSVILSQISRSAAADVFYKFRPLNA